MRRSTPLVKPQCFRRQWLKHGDRGADDVEHGNDSPGIHGAAAYEGVSPPIEVLFDSEAAADTYSLAMAKKWIDDNSELMQAALVARKDVTVIWHLIHVLEKLEKGVP
jgi:hypothetical protein